MDGVAACMRDPQKVQHTRGMHTDIMYIHNVMHILMPILLTVIYVFTMKNESPRGPGYLQESNNGTETEPGKVDEEGEGEKS